jgi:hypothetical protein
MTPQKAKTKKINKILNHQKLKKEKPNRNQNNED